LKTTIRAPHFLQETAPAGSFETFFAAFQGKNKNTAVKTSTAAPTMSRSFMSYFDLIAESVDWSAVTVAMISRLTKRDSGIRVRKLIFGAKDNIRPVQSAG
jgi:hypothetical protein